MLVDAVIAEVGYLIAYMMTLSGGQLINYIQLYKETFFLFAVIYLTVYYFMGIYGQMWRYAIMFTNSWTQNPENKINYTHE